MLADIEQRPFLPHTTLDTPLLARYEALTRVSDALRAARDHRTLVKSLGRELQAILAFDNLGLAIYDEARQVVQPYVVDASGAIVEAPRLALEDSLACPVIRQQQPIVISRVSTEARFPEAMTCMRQHGIESLCALPLTTPKRRIGVMLLASREPFTYDHEDMTFLSLLAGHVAQVIGDALDQGLLRHSSAGEGDSVRALGVSDELLRALSPVLDVRQVLPQISDIAARILPHDLLTLTFHDDDGRIALEGDSDGSTDAPARFSATTPSTPCESGPASARIVADLTTERCRPAEVDALLRDRLHGEYRSVLAVRLSARDQQIGLQFWSARPNAFEAHHTSAALHVGDHVALAVSHERLAETAREAAEARLRADRLDARVRALSKELAAKSGVNRLVGSSPAWQGALKAAAQVAATDSTVLLVGESGTGKEVIARFIHRASSRGGAPFVALNCAALPEQLLESELFGHERGAFTGAQQAKPGQIELAEGGVLFLDEVGEMSPAAQAKFLRVLQEREFQRLGGTRTLKADVRVIAATNKDLTAAMERGEFREDLFYRLQVFDIRLPSLRERTEDIVPLAGEFLREIGLLSARPPAVLTKSATDALVAYRWPGNVRELHNALERAAILAEGGPIAAEHLGLTNDRLTTIEGARTGPMTQLKTIEREMIVQALSDSAGNKSKAAARLGLSRTQLYVRLRRYQLA